MNESEDVTPGTLFKARVSESEDGSTMDRFNELLLVLKAEKPNDRSEKDRYYAVLITDLEKVMAYYRVFLWNPPISMDQPAPNTRQTG